VVPAIASALGISLGFDDPIAGAIDVLRSKKLLLIIDNCEHVIAMAATLVERISSEVPDARIIATSREPLRTRHEQIHFLSGLAYPDQLTALSASDALQFPAVQLFITKAHGSAFTEPADGYVRSVVSICTRLEGLALAIELAAGTAGVLAPEALEDLFKHGFDSMSRGARDAPLRHQTLEATLDWSYRLLPDREAILLDLLSVFSGRFNADDVEAMYSAGALEPMTGRDALSQLVAKSLVSSIMMAGPCTTD
jgi:predicted ATPase